jgi:acyl dehydratase
VAQERQNRNKQYEEQDGRITRDEPEWIPAHLSAPARQALVDLTRPSAAHGTEIECSEHLIRHWCETVEDGNPLYLDTEYAQSLGFAGIVAPPALAMATLSIPYRWPWPPKKHVPTTNLHYQVKKIMNLPVGVVVDTEIEFVRHLEPGDTLTQVTRLVSMTGPKRTRLGEGYFWVLEFISSNQRDQVVFVTRLTMFAYNPAGNATHPTGDNPDEEAPDGRHPATEACLEANRGTETHSIDTVYWDQVEVGDPLPPLFMPVTVTRCVMLASATRDFAPHHHNRDYAQNEVQARDMFLNTPFNLGLLSRFVTDWAGPRGTVRRLRLAMSQNICAGDDMTINGRVSRKFVDGDNHGVDIEIVVSTQDGPAYGASASVLLPVRP